MRKSTKYLPIFFVLPALIYLTVIGIIPLFFSAGISFFRYPLKRPELGITFTGLTNYINAFDPTFQLVGVSFISTLSKMAIFLVAAITIEFFLGLALANAMKRETKVFSVMRPLMLIPMIVSPVAVALMGRFLFHQSFGFINQLLGTTGFAWYALPSLALPIVILMDVWEWTPFMFLLILAGISSVPKEVIEAAEIDGVSSSQQLRWIVLPIIKPIIAVALFFRLLDALKIFDIPWILTRGGPGMALELPNVHIFRMAFRNSLIGYSAALSIIVLVISLVIVLVMIKILRPMEHALEEI